MCALYVSSRPQFSELKDMSSGAGGSLLGAFAIAAAALGGFLGRGQLEGPLPAAPTPAPPAEVTCACACEIRLALPALHLPLELAWCGLGVLLAVAVLTLWRKAASGEAVPRRPATLALR